VVGVVVVVAVAVVAAAAIAYYFRVELLLFGNRTATRQRR
jgi:hypothetical protein